MKRELFVVAVLVAFGFGYALLAHHYGQSWWLCSGIAGLGAGTGRVLWRWVQR